MEVRLTVANSNAETPLPLPPHLPVLFTINMLAREGESDTESLGSFNEESEAGEPEDVSTPEPVMVAPRVAGRNRDGSSSIRGCSGFKHHVLAASGCHDVCAQVLARNVQEHVEVGVGRGHSW